MPRVPLCSVVLCFALSAAGLARAYEANDRWNNTATDGSTGSQGDPVTLTWGFVDDGTRITGGAGEPTSDSDLLSFLDTEIGAGAWLSIFTDSFDRLSALAGLSFAQELNDTGQAINATANPFGRLGVRPDLRIGGHSIDGQLGSNTLAYNYFPDHGDMVLDTDNSTFFANSTNNYRGFRNTIMHEVGHGLGLSHVDSSTAGLLMEPSISTAFDGPQLDDILGLQRNYGDIWEKGGGNDAFGSATALDPIVAGGISAIGTDGASVAVLSTQTDFVSIDDNSDVDFFSLILTEELVVALNLTPQGVTYNVGPQGGTQTSFDSKSLSDLTLQLLDTDGTTVLETANNAPAGLGETIESILPAGTYYAHVTGSADDVQLYELSVSSFYGADFDEDGNVDLEDLDNWQAGYGIAGTAMHMDGDANGNQYVNGLDFLAWQRQFGSGIEPLAGLAVAPEPAAVLLMLIGMAVIFAGRSHL